MTTLITGGAGFIGSNFIPFYMNENPEVNVVNLDKLTYAGSLEYLKSVETKENYHFVLGDICDKVLVDSIFKKHRIDSVIHFAAESHVDNSITSPDNFIKTNIEGTFVLLDIARKHWGENNHKCRFHHISTDEVFGSLDKEGFFTESTAYAPNSPYSASKAAADFLVRSYHQTYGLNVVSSNCSNNFGPKQHDEKLIPTIIRKAINNEDIPIYGSGKNIRDWLFVLDHCRGINNVFKKGISGETYLIGGNNELTNIQVAEQICTILDVLKPKTSGTYSDQITFVKDRKGHDFRYAIDASKIKNELGWMPERDFEFDLTDTVKWYLDKYLKSKG